MSQDLFSEFKKSNDQQVKDQILKDLNGLDYESTLLWNSLEGITTQPFYDRESQKRGVSTNSFPEHWNTAHTIEVKQQIESAVRFTEAAVKSDVEVVVLRWTDSELSVEAFSEAFKSFKATFYVVFEFLPEDAFLEKVQRNFKNKKKWFFLFDPIERLAQSGDWFLNQNSDLHQWQQLINSQDLQTPLYVDGRIHQNAGATISQQLAYSLSQAVDYLTRINVSENTELSVLFHLALGSNYFFEIAKIQALKTLFNAVVSKYDFNVTFKIIAEPSTRNMTLQDYNVNMLRSTTASMAAVLGGADIIHNLPYDTLFNPPNTFGDRIAQNQLLILKNESFFDRTTNPVEGSYYIEQLIIEFSDLSLHLFKDIEKQGGFLNLLLADQIQKEIINSAQKEQALFDSGEMVLVGVNRYQDFDAPKTSIKISSQKNPKKGLIEPIQPKRLSENLELVYGK